jgi:hypothetical protein
VHAVARTYSGQGASAVFDLVAERDEDVKALLGGVPGFVKENISAPGNPPVISAGSTVLQFSS